MTRRWGQGAAVVLVVAAVCAVVSPAEARWNPKRFAKLLEEADAQFLARRWPEAQGSYLELRQYLSESLEKGQIPEEQRERARQALGTIDYQIGRTTHLLSGCHAAYLKYAELRAVENLEFAVAVKVEMRMAETLLCRASEELGRGELTQAQSDLELADSQLAATTERRLHVALTEEQADELRRDLASQSGGVLRIFTGMERWGERECASAKVMGQVLDRLPTALVVEGREAFRARLGQECASPVTQRPQVPPESETAWGPWALLGVGALGIVGVGINEARLLPTSDGLETARTECATGVASSCTKASLLASDVKSGQVVTAVLLGVGAVGLIGGGIWLWLSEGDDAQAPEGGARVGLGWWGTAGGLMGRW